MGLQIDDQADLEISKANLADFKAGRNIMENIPAGLTLRANEDMVFVHSDNFSSYALILGAEGGKCILKICEKL
jgi:hypothetical protein